MLRKLLVTTAVAASAIGIFAGGASASAHPSSTSGGGHLCSYTSPSYTLADDNMSVHSNPGTTQYTAKYTGHGKYQDAYWTTGWSRKVYNLCDDRAGANGPRPGRLGGAPVVANLSAHGSGRLGFDLWLTPNGLQHTNATMEASRNTWEIMVQPGRSGWKSNPGWHRIYVGNGGSANSISWYNVNLTAIAEKAGVPKSYMWTMIGAGAETNTGSFSVSSYYLHVKTWVAAHWAVKPKWVPGHVVKGYWSKGRWHKGYWRNRHWHKGWWITRPKWHSGRHAVGGHWTKGAWVKGHWA